MSQSLTLLLESMRRGLRDDVQPELTTEFARTQMAGVIDMLSKFEQMMVWSPDVLRERLEAMATGAAAFTERGTAAGLRMPPAAVLALPENWRMADLENAVRAGEAQMVLLSDWLFDIAAVLPVDLFDELDGLLRQALRATLMAERRLVPRANFSAMTDAGG